MFHHAYDGYIKYAYPYDELRPLTCDGHDTWGRYVLAHFMSINIFVLKILCAFMHLLQSDLVTYCLKYTSVVTKCISR